MTSNFHFDFIQEIESRTKNSDNKTISEVETRFETCDKTNSELFLVEESVMSWLGDNLEASIKNAHLYDTLTHTAHTGAMCNILVRLGRQIESLIYQEKALNEEQNYTDSGGLTSIAPSVPGNTNLSLDERVTKVMNCTNEKDDGRGKGAESGAVRSQGRTVSLAENMSQLRCTASQLLSTYRGACLFLLKADVVKETSKFR